MKITTIDTGLAFNIIPESQLIKTFHKLGTEQNFLSLIKHIYEKPTANKINNDKGHKSELDTIMISLLLKLIRFHAIPIKVTVEYFAKIDKRILKII